MLHNNSQLFVIYYIIYLMQYASAYRMRLPAPELNIFSNSDNTPCELPITKVDPAELKWPHKGIAPWNAQPNTTVYNSSSVTNAINALRSASVPGLNSTFGETFAVFQNVNCSLYIHGDAVRDYLLGLSPTDIDIEYSCHPNVLEAACINTYGNDSCHFIHSPYFYVGQKDTSSAFDVLEGVNWNSTFFGPPFTKEYTTNTISYDLNGNDIIIDIIGSGVSDTCSKLIRIPVDESIWSQWLTESYYLYKNGLRKLPRYWKLRADPKSYKPADNDTMFFVQTNVKKLWKNETFNVEYAFRNFYCDMVDGNLSGDASGCCVLSPLHENVQNKLDAYNVAIENDLGTKWYQSHIVEGNVNRISVQCNDEEGTIDKWHAMQAVGIAAGAALVVLAVMFCIVRRRKIDEINEMKALMESYDDRL